MIISSKNNKYYNSKGKLNIFGWIVNVRFYLWFLVMFIAILLLIIQTN
jgi:hypothetical protein